MTTYTTWKCEECGVDMYFLTESLVPLSESEERKFQVYCWYCGHGQWNIMVKHLRS